MHQGPLVGKPYAIAMARYNSWQNRSLYTCAAALDDAQRKVDRGAFFASVHATLNHILWADRVWLSRFEGAPQPSGGTSDSTALYDVFDELRAAREEADAALIAWSLHVDPDWFEGDLVWYSGILKREVSKPKGQLVAHFFNHQTHHRGQVHALLTAMGQKPEDTDLMLMQLD